MYSDIVKDHFKNPRNVGEIENPDGVGEVGNPVCGDMMNISIKIENDRIEDIKFLTFGCGAAIAVSSILTEMAKGKSLDDARKITNADVARALEGLPKNKLHCSNLGADALQAAIKDYEGRLAGIAKPETLTEEAHAPSHDSGKCYCPYCESILPQGIQDAPFCSNCGQTVEIEHEH